MTQNSTENRPRHSRWHAFAEFFTDRFNLEEDKAQRDEVVENISKGVVFRGVNLWILIFATIIASLGLNVNSAAVIIGAMLVSPLMGPIMGIGLSLGINDFDLLKKALRNFGLMIAVSIIASTLYFFISPLSDARSELLARTVPTTYDVLIAFFGGMAGMIAQTRKDRNSTVIPGVAIATALMPPLCTAGFGLVLNIVVNTVYVVVNAVILTFVNANVMQGMPISMFPMALLGSFFQCWIVGYIVSLLWAQPAEKIARNIMNDPAPDMH